MFSLGLLACAGLVLSEPISTDRPDFTETNKAVEIGVLQVESGITAAWSDSERAIGGPELLLRYGIAKGVEARFGVPNYTTVSGEGPEGFDDLYVGAKLELSPDLAIIPAVTIPTDGRLASDETGAEIVLAWGRDMDDRHAVGAGFGKSLTDDSWLATVVIGRSLSDQLGVFLEAVLEGADDEVGAIAHFGAAYRPRPRMQFDAHAGIGLNRHAPDWFIGVGFSVKQ